MNSSLFYKSDFTFFKRNLSICLLLTIPLHSQAANCYYTAPYAPETISITLPSALTLPRDAAIGTQIFESPLHYHATNNKYYCETPHPWGIRNDRGPDSPTSDLFPIGNTGISWQYVLDGRARKGYGEFTEGSGYRTFERVTTAIRLIKTGNVNTGTRVSAGELGSIQASGLKNSTITLRNSAIFIASSCETPDVKVNMGDYEAGAFREVGSSSTLVHFNINLLNCPSGINKVNYTLEPTSTSPAWNRDLGIIKLNQGSTAKGLALQIMNKIGDPIPLNKAQTFNYLNAGGNFAIPLTARYYRTTPSTPDSPGIVAGTADAEISFIMSYL
ncbi:type 1 fimbrial protein [Pseudomonas sp. CK-NBRI-02]|uniref:fimbrial protein n=1 Tax=Pseudomonas sp. CK-NBRI-02 TaxID=2249759 RepID=UPI0009B7622C|nr:fimbrial protein [Pseudomonas sp. CK-NBRI-02]TYO70652.1 type 1 fimbrial protein [Pseudomonas sp. CK-NBRI-02]